MVCELPPAELLREPKGARREAQRGQNKKEVVIGSAENGPPSKEIFLTWGVGSEEHLHLLYFPATGSTKVS